MHTDFHVNLPGEVVSDINDIIEYEKLLQPVTGVKPSNFGDVVLEAILYYKLYCKQSCEIYGVLPVKEDK